jgi:hypothetical protein
MAFSKIIAISAICAVPVLPVLQQEVSFESKSKSVKPFEISFDKQVLMFESKSENGKSELELFKDAALQTGKRYGVPFEVIYGVAFNESALGKSNIALNSNNWFGIRYPNCGKDGRYYQTSGNGMFCRFESVEEAVEKFCIFVCKHYYRLPGKPHNVWSLPGYGSKKYVKSYWAQFSQHKPN